MRILVTGANGFVGRALCSEALARGAAVRGVTRTPCDLPIGVDNVVVGSLAHSIEKTRRLLGWAPPLSLDQGLKRAAD